MARRYLRTPEGAWYRGYPELKPHHHHMPHSRFSPPSKSYDRPWDHPDTKRSSFDSPRNRHGYFDPPDPKPYKSFDGPMNGYERKMYGHGDSERDGKLYSKNGTVPYYDERNEPYGYRPPLYDPHSHQHYGDARPKWEERDGKEDTRRSDGPQHVGPEDDKHHLFSYRDAPANGKDHDFPKRDVPGDAKPWDFSRRNSPADFGNNDTSKYHGAAEKERAWERERERELAGNLSQRKAPSYEPSFHDPAASPRNIPPWERERGYPRSPHDPLMGKMEVPRLTVSRRADSVFLFIRFRKECHHIMGRACLAARCRDLHGHFTGIARKAFDFGYTPGKDGKDDRYGCAVFQFPSMENAQVFYNRDRRLRQHDFPSPDGQTEIYAVTVQCDPGLMMVYNTFFLSEVTLKDRTGDAMQNYDQEFREAFSALLKRYGALPYAAFSDCSHCRSLKRHYFGPYDLVTLHLFHSVEHLEEVMRDPDYTKLRIAHNQMATEKCSVFTLEPQACP